MSKEETTFKGGVSEENEETQELPKISGIQNLPKDKVQENVQEIEKEKQEYLEKNEKEKDNQEASKDNLNTKNNQEELNKQNLRDGETTKPHEKSQELGGEAQEEFDEEPEFKSEKEINKKEDEILDIF